MSLMEMSFYGAVLILIILAVRAGLKNRLPKITFIVLWMLALLRLLVPFSISSAWSVYTYLPDADSVTEYAQRLAQAADGKDDGERGMVGLTQDQTRIPDQGILTEPNPDTAAISSRTWDKGGAASEKTSIAEPTAHRLSIWNIIWAAGFVLCTAYFTWIYFRCCREFQMSLPINNGMLRNWYSTHPLKRKLSVRQSDQIDSPLSYGICRPVILLPKSTKWEEGFQLRYVLEHEYVHIRHFDAAIKIFMAAALCIHWFNPMVWLMYIFFNRDLELYCDETVIRRFGEEEKSAYAMTLIEMEEEKGRVIFLGNNFSKNAIEERIRAVMKIKKISLLDLGTAVILIGGITLLFATSCKAYEEAETTRTAEAQEYTGLEEYTKENSSTGISVEEVPDRSAVVYNKEEIKKLKTEVQKREKELDELIQAKEAEQSASDFDMDALVQEIGQLKEERVSLQDVKDDLEWYDFVEEHYKEYGISYHFPENRLYSVNTPIRYFYDEKNGGVLWADNEGEVVLEVVYDKQGKILCLSGGPAESDEAVDTFFTDAAADAVHKAGKAAKSRAREVTAVVEDAAKDSVNIPYAISKSKEFSEYKKFGISYDKTTGDLIYKGKTIGYFMDETAPGVYTRFVDGSGTLGITVVRDSGKITRIVSFPFDEKSVSNGIASEDIDYGKEAEAAAMESEEIEYTNEIVSEAAAGDAAYDSGDDVESSISKEYEGFGLTWDKRTNQWMYWGKGVAVLYDKDYAVYTNDTIPEKKAVYLEVRRDKKGRVTELREVTKTEIQNLLQED